MRSRFKPVYFLLFLLFFSCSRPNPLVIDVSNIQVKIEIERLDQKLFEAKSDELAELNRECIQRYGELWETYVTVMLRAGVVQDSLLPVSLDRFINDEVMKQVYQDIQIEFADLSEYTRQLEESFKHLIYYFPDIKVPQIVTYNSVFNYGVATFENKIGVGLDMYLGPKNRTVEKISTEMMPQYVKDKMLKEYLVVDIMRGWFETNFMKELSSGDDFLTSIIHQGKILYALDALMPEEMDHIKIRFSEDQLQWCINNEENIWKSIIDQKLLYSKNQGDISKFIEEAPFTSGLPQNSPGRVGVFIGWQMVRSYMEEFPEKKLPDLIREDNPRTILKFYKPKK